MSAFGLSASGFTVALGLTSVAIAGPVQYRVMDLGTLGGSYSVAQDINDHGQVVGWSETADGKVRAFRTSPNAAINPATDNLGVFDYSDLRTPPREDDFSMAHAINNHGEVVGQTRGAGFTYAFRSRPNATLDYHRDLIPPVGGSEPLDPVESYFTNPFYLSTAYDINDEGVAVVTTKVLSGIMPLEIVAVSRDNSKRQHIGFRRSEDGNVGTGINNKNQVVGNSEQDHPNPVNMDAFVAEPFADPPTIRHLTTETVHGDGTSTWVNAFPMAISDNGLIVGTTQGGVDFRDLSLGFGGEAFVAPSDGLIDQTWTLLGKADGFEHSVATDVNEAGVVVGYSFNSDETGIADSLAFVYIDGTRYELNDYVAAPQDWLFLTAEGINEHGQITGTGLINGQRHGYVLSLFDDGTKPPVIPLPAPVALGLVGLLGGAIATRLRRRGAGR